jgi:probable phosphoglycerate mutase
VWQGSTDSPLSDRGLRQAECLAQFMGQQYSSAVALYSSHLQRARHTAQAIGATLNLPLRIDEDLREYDLGSWEGKSYAELFQKHRLWHHIRTDPHFAPHGGESPRQVADRFTGVLRRIVQAHPGGCIVVVAHGGALSMALAELVEGDYTKWGRVMDNCAVTELALNPEPELVHFNLNAHLEGI